MHSIFLLFINFLPLKKLGIIKLQSRNVQKIHNGYFIEY